ncbi:MAG: hypothetical protein V2B18_06755 [Pseudomonadota bacterium]
MAKKSSKHANVQQLSLVLSGGLNYSTSAGNIADNELVRAKNFIYAAATDKLMARPGTDCVTASALPSPATIGFYYEVTATEAYHVCAAGAKLYYILNADPLGTSWTEIGTNLLTGDYPPSFLVFNNLLLIADGDTGIKSWAGAVIGTVSTGIANSPPANALSMIRNRVVANSITDLDLVTLSAPNDATATGWNTTTTAVGLRAGYGDLLTVNAFAVYGDDLIVSKKGDREKRLYRINVASATTTNWYVQDLSQNNAAQNAHSIVSAWNNVFFVDTNGFKSVKGTDTYGDLQVDAIGRKINTVFQDNLTCDSMVYLPAYNAIWFGIGDRVFCYTERYDPQSGANLPAFTNIFFEWGRCTSFYQAGDDVYLTGYNGYLYKVDESLATDEETPGVTSAYVCTVRTKTFTFFGDGILRKLQFYVTPKATGTGIISVCTAENEKTAVLTFTPEAEGQYLYDATGYLAVATGFLYDTGTSPKVETTRNRIRSDEMAFDLELTTGRCGVEWCKAEIALVEGGD